MRRLSYLLLPLLLLLSCSKEEKEGGWDGPVIELTLVTPVDMETRAGSDGTQDGINKYNENLISWVDFFFYPGGETDADATYHVRRTSGKQRSDVMRIELTSEQVNSIIFPSAPEDIRTCTVFAVVNYPGTLVAEAAEGGEEDLSGTSLTALEALTVQTDFVSPANHRQPNFMMSGRVELTLRGRTQVVAAAATIDLRRYACKLTVGVDVSDAVTVSLGEAKTETWRPMLSGMEIYLVNGVSDVALSGEKTVDPAYFTYRDNALRFAYTDMQDVTHFYFEKEGNYYNTYPTYMYPQHWDYGSTESPRKEPFLKLVVPWVRDADPAHGITKTQKQYYYKVMIPDDRRSEYKRSFVRNNWYHINIRVGILGSETDEATVPVLSGSCFIVYWQDKDVVIKNAEIGNARYLSVDQETYELHNVAATQIHYTTSHPVVIQNIRATRPYFGDNPSVNSEKLGGVIKKAGNNDIYTKDTYYLEYDEAHRRALNGGEDWLTDTGTSIAFNHPLNNDYTTELFDYSPYTVSFRLRHSDRPDDDQYEKTVKIEQSPAVYIETLLNSADNPVYKGGKDKRYWYTSTYWGYVYVDGAQHSCYEYDALANAYVAGGDTWDLGSSNNSGGTVRTKPDMLDLQWRIVNYTGGSRDIFKIYITVLPENSDFVIGDPRKDEVDNLDPVRRDGVSVPFCTAPAIEGGTRSMTWYYPTDPSDRTRNLMAPSYRIASKHGGVEYYNGIQFEEAQYRCASYQEDGFPAGRWRLPTRGEIRFIAMLSANNAFTFLFSKGSYYWSANGAIKVLDSDLEDAPSQPYALARCVYDTWYWGDDQLENRAQFTWGDQPR